MQQSGLVASYLLDGHDGGQRLDWEQVAAWRPDDGLLWVHLNRDRRCAQMARDAERP